MLLKAKATDSSPAIGDAVIDIVFLLLIFFLVATTFQQSEREMQIALPEAESGGPISISAGACGEHRADGTVIVGGRAVSTDDLRTIVGDAVEANPEQKVTVRDKSATYDRVVGVLDVCKAAGIQRPCLDTVPLR